MALTPNGSLILFIPRSGEDHQRHRKIMHPAFSAPQLRTFLPLFQRIAGKVRRTAFFVAA